MKLKGTVVCAFLMLVPFSVAQYACYYTAPNGNGGCDCFLGFNDGWCSCVSLGKSCKLTGGMCTQYGGCNGGTRPPSVALRAKAKEIVSAHKTIVTIFTQQACVEGAFGRAVISEAAKQGKAVRFLVPPAGLRGEELARYNQRMIEFQKFLRREEEQLNKIWTAPVTSEP